MSDPFYDTNNNLLEEAYYDELDAREELHLPFISFEAWKHARQEFLAHPPTMPAPVIVDEETCPF